MQYEEYCTLKLHAARVMGLAIDGKKNWILSVAEDKKFKVADLSYQEAQADIQPDVAPLKNLEYDEENQRVFIISGSGQLFIYSLAEKPPKLVRESETGSKDVLRDLSVDYMRNYIFTCAMDGMISVLETGKPGKDRFTKLVGSMKGASKARCVRWRSSKLEAVVAYESGKVCFWNIQTGQVAYVFDPHILSITKICWDEKNQILYTGSKDKSIKVWRIPGEWNVYYAKKEEKKAEAIKTQEVKQREREGSDEDSDDNDLKGWANK
eukprot:TRINITY_DN3170_c0_g1_i14.p1 TRINITY_DN3170_c0_g1~~TRINITY_DN3170_c0_g1_i14.p1  ORF type:complete len:266 (+),score=83.40 TRINITY_DN3170_c0_g1_i14:989-1786(+)